MQTKVSTDMPLSGPGGCAKTMCREAGFAGVLVSIDQELRELLEPVNTRGGQDRLWEVLFTSRMATNRRYRQVVEAHIDGELDWDPLVADNFWTHVNVACTVCLRPLGSLRRQRFALQVTCGVDDRGRQTATIRMLNEQEDAIQRAA